MCLTTDKSYPVQPDGSIRWKLMRVTEDGRVHGTNDGEFEVSRIGDIRLAEEKYGSKFGDGVAGVHVCATEDGFKATCDGYYGWERRAKVKVECRGFICGGPYQGGGIDAIHECWKEVTVLEVEPINDGFIYRHEK